MRDARESSLKIEGDNNIVLQIDQLLRFDKTVHVHKTVYAPVAPDKSAFWQVGFILLFMGGAVTLLQAMLPEATHFTKPTVAMVNFDSDRISAIGYDPSSNKLFVEFPHLKDEAATYCNVPVDLYDGFLAAKSKGGYWRQWLFDGKYGCKT